MIEKESGASLRKAGIWTTDVPNYLIEKIRNPDALAIWVYLLKQSPGWVARSTQLMDHFDIGRDRYRAAIKVLRDMELFWTYQVKDAAGRIIDNSVVISMLPASDLEKMSIPGIQDSVSPDSPGIQVSGRPENPSLGKTDPLITYSKESNNGINSNRRFAPPTPLEVSEYAKAQGIPVDGDSFCDFYASKGWRIGKEPMKDWKAAARNWGRKAGQQTSSHWSTQGLVL